MQSLSPEIYERLRRLAAAWKRQHGEEIKSSPRYNARLAVDALCFQRLASDEVNDDYLVGALLTPVSLSLVLAPLNDEASAPTPGERRHFALPSGRYPFVAERLEPPLWLWRCELLDELTDVGSLQEASRLAQKLMDRVMAPGE